MSIQFPYRAVICGEEHIVKGWRGRKLLTDKGSYSVRHFYPDWQIQAARILEMATLGLDTNNRWLINGHDLHSLSSRPDGLRFNGITSNEALRVHKGGICGVAWVQSTDDGKVTGQLDKTLRFWETVAQPIKVNENALLAGLDEIGKLCLTYELFKNWSVPIWLTEFRPAARKIPISPQQKQFARIATELHETKTQLCKAKAATHHTLKQALLGWMKFNPQGMSADTKARISKAVQMYSTETGMHSLTKIAAAFKVSKKTVSVWFKAFTEETSFQVVTFQRHVSVGEQLKAKLEQDAKDAKDAQDAEEQFE